VRTTGEVASSPDDARTYAALYPAYRALYPALTPTFAALAGG
jgi:hypothetical protein